MPDAVAWATLRTLSEQLQRGEVQAADLVEAALARIDAADTPDGPVFLRRFDSEARREALAVDNARARGEAVSPWAGIPFAVKDLFDVSGHVTHAGAVATRDDPPARHDATVVAALRQAGLIPVGATNMTEFAFSGIGINPHYGTPEAAPWPGERRAPGGSSSGAGVSVARQMVPLSLGTDTAGSCRIPAAWNNVVGLKPSQSRVSRDGVFPLSTTLDAPGPLAQSADCCRIADALMRGVMPAPAPSASLSAFRFIAPVGDRLPPLDDDVAEHYRAALQQLEDAGATVVEQPAPAFEQAAEAFLSRPIAGYEAWLVHRDRLAARGGEYDPNVAARLRAGANVDPAEHARTVAERRHVADAFRADTPPKTVHLLPTTANTPPSIDALARDNDLFAKQNLRALVYTSIANYLDGCALSLPIGRGVGLSLIGPSGTDDALFDAAEAVEHVLSRSRSTP
ncbi:MAG: amidase family protein [Pseudomonadota bacterium]